MKVSLPSIPRTRRILAIGLLVAWLSSGCTLDAAAPRNGTIADADSAQQPLRITINAPPTATSAPPTATPIPPTATPVPLAARVNDEAITLEQFHSELAHYLDTADPNDPQATAAQQVVLTNMIQRAVLLQEAARAGVTVSEARIEEEIALARARAGGDEEYVTWLAASKLTPEEARERIRIALITAAMRDRVIAAVPREAEHVRAFHILVGTELEAQQMLDRLDAGAVLGPLATRYSLDDGTRADEGDLGWFPQGAGAVIWPEVEEATFQLQPGETSGIVASPAGFHIVRVVAREVRPLSEAHFTALQARALETWMNALLDGARVERFL
jgi:parvulin-like peptidyl-prolyl isomerase